MLKDFSAGPPLVLISTAFQIMIGWLEDSETSSSSHRALGQPAKDQLRGWGEAFSEGGESEGHASCADVCT